MNNILQNIANSRKRQIRREHYARLALRRLHKKTGSKLIALAVSFKKSEARHLKFLSSIDDKQARL